MTSITTWAAENPTQVLLAWGLASAIFNIVVRFKTPEEWIAFGERYPASAAVIRVIRAAGIDPRKVIIAIGQALEARARRKGDS